MGLTGRQRISVIFKINEEGYVVEIKSRAPHPKLETEAIRAVKTLPKMIPGKHKGENVIVPYSLPIIFEVADYSKNKQTIPVDIEEEIEVPFAVIENVPTFPGCEEGDNAQKKKCMSDKISSFVAKNFNTKLASNLGLSGRQTIRAMFKIDKQGDIIDIKVRAAHPRLEEETRRVISSIPKMIPGMQKGKAVVVPYSLPIIFEVKESPNAIISYLTTENSNSKKDVEKQDLKEVPLVALDESPIYPGCDTTSSNNELKECFKNSITNFISKEFGKNLPKNIDSELEPRQKILAMFKIDKTGYIESIRVRAKHPELEKEAIRVIKLLPKMTPGKHKGKTVIVPYSVPIIYELGKKKN